jgi:hypothetical protein
MQGDDPGWRKYLQNFKNLVESLADHATRRQRRSHLRTSTNSRIPCKASIKSTSRTASSVLRSLSSGGRTPRRTVPTRRTFAQPSPTRQRTEDHSSRCTLNIATRCV